MADKNRGLPKQRINPELKFTTFLFGGYLKIDGDSTLYARNGDN